MWRSRIASTGPERIRRDTGLDSVSLNRVGEVQDVRDLQRNGAMRPALRVGLLSDTHVPTGLPRLPEELLTKLVGVDCILHAGDLLAVDVLEALNAVAPTTAVTGNMDPPELARRLAPRELLHLAGRTVGLAHGHQPPSLQHQYIGRSYDSPEFDFFYQAMVAQLPGAEIIVFGHFHVPIVRVWHGVLFVNPGSIAPPHAGPTFALLDLGIGVTARIVPL